MQIEIKEVKVTNLGFNLNAEIYDFMIHFGTN
jgi:hypothetical protein